MHSALTWSWPWPYSILSHAGKYLHALYIQNLKGMRETNTILGANIEVLVVNIGHIWQIMPKIFGQSSAVNSMQVRWCLSMSYSFKPSSAKKLIKLLKLESGQCIWPTPKTRTRPGRGSNRSSATANVMLYCTWCPSGLTIGLHEQGTMPIKTHA